MDMGYDISDYEDIHPKYRALADVDKLINELRSRKMNLIMDFMVNHTSNQISYYTAPNKGRTPSKCKFFLTLFWRPWFLESRSSTTNKKRD